jgi:CO/xanthine dehydrogenase Mo-binding subunit
VSRDGRFLARDVQIYWNTGAYADIGVRVPRTGGFYCLGPYRHECVRIDSAAVYTNLPPAGAFRGYAGVQAAWAHERQADLIAQRLGLDPLELRLKNILESGDRFASGERMEDVHWKELLEDASRHIGWRPAGSADSATDDRDEDGRLRGRGLAVSLLVTITPSTSSAIVKLNEDGSATVLSSTVEMGQGARTVLSQIAADTLALPLERVAITDPDTDTTPYDLTTTASRSTVYMGEAIRSAARDAQEQLFRWAASLLEVSADDLEAAAGRVSVRGLPEKSLSFGEVIRRSGAGDITGRGTGRSLGGWDARTGEGRLTSQWHQGAAAAEVAVDPETGVVEVTKLHLAAWLGRVAHPVLASLQNEGNAAFGIGQAMTEEMVFDGGQLVNANLGDYLIPSFEDLPRQLTTAALEEDGAGPDTEMHGLGETTLPQVAPAIANAIQAATGASLVELPITPQRVLESLLSRETASESG